MKTEFQVLRGLVALNCFVLAIALTAGCSKSNPSPTANINAENVSENFRSGDRQGHHHPGDVNNSGLTNVSRTPADPDHPRVLIRTNEGDIVVRLDAEKSPLTVENFLGYVDSNFYQNTIFHQVDKGFVILGGGYTANMQEKSGLTPIRNEAHNGLKNRRGTIAMARDPENIDSATCQFFINLANNTSLDYHGREVSDYGYCVFGEITEGMDVIDRIGQTPVQTVGQAEKTPVRPIVIESVRRL